MKKFFRENGGLILIIAVLLAAVLGVTGAIFNVNPVSNILGVITTPFRDGLNAVANWMEDGYNYAFRYEELEEENQRLRERVAELEQDAREYEDAVSQNARLRNLLGLQERRFDFEFEEATVTVRSSTNWESVFTINKGSSSQVEVGDCVVDEYGNLVGVINEVQLNWSTLATVVDASTELGGRIVRTDDTAVLEGDFSLMRQGLLRLSYLPEDTELISGDQITTSGVGTRYPSGLVVGSIQSVLTDDSGLSRYAEVVPAADLENVKYVYVIKSFDVVE